MEYSFYSHSEERMDEVSIPEKQELIRQCVDRIYVDHDWKIISCYVREIPIITREVLNLYTGGLKNKPATLRSPVVTEIVAGAGSRSIPQLFIHSEISFSELSDYYKNRDISS